MAADRLDLGKVAAVVAAASERVARRSPSPRDLPFFGLDHPPGILGRALADLADLGIFRFYSDVLDVSPGWGGPARWLVRRNRCRVTAVHRRRDEARAASRLTAAAHLSDSVASIGGSVCALPLRTGTFTHVWGVDLLAEVEDARAAFREILRVLRPGGWLALGEPGTGRDAGIDDACRTLVESGACDVEVRDVTTLLEEDSAVAKLVEERVRSEVTTPERALPGHRVHLKARKPA